jgi:hypothetical protein
MIYRKHRCLERQTFGTPRMYTLSPSKSIKGSNYGKFLIDKNVMLCTRLYKYSPNLESLLTQQYVCVMCTLWSNNTCVFTRFHSVKNANTQLIWSSVILVIMYVETFKTAVIVFISNVILCLTSHLPIIFSINVSLLIHEMLLWVQTKNVYRVLSLSWLYGSWIYNYLYNQCLSLLKLWVWIPLMVRCTW